MPTAADMAQLGANLLASYRVRRTGIGSIRDEANAHRRQAHQFLGELQRGAQARKAEVEAKQRQAHQFLGELQRGSQARQRAAATHLRQTFQFVGELHRGSQARKAEVEADQRQTSQFMGGLQRGSQARKAEVEADQRQTHYVLRQARDFVGELHRGGQARKAEVAEILAGSAAEVATYASEVQGALAEWNRQLAALSLARGATATWPRPKLSPVLEPATPQFEGDPAHMGGEAEPELAERIVAFVAAHPGTRLPAIEEELGVSRIEVGRTIRELMDQAKVQRNDTTREYFPI